MLPPEVTMSSDHLYWFGDKLYLLNDCAPIDPIVYKFRYPNKHPDVTRTLVNVSRITNILFPLYVQNR